jgi:hypothetical protein
MNNISEEELLALQTAHAEVDSFRWQIRKRRVLIRAVLVLVLILFRVLMLKIFPQTYVPLIFGDSDVGAAELGSLITTRLLIGAALGGLYIYALMANHYVKFASIVALMAPVTLICADLQMFLVSSFPDFTLVASISFCLRLLTIYLLALNYIDLKR